MTSAPRIVRWSACAGADALVPAIEAVFFEASATRAFESTAAREAFFERWLGRYLSHDPALVHLALGHDGAVLGYLAGALDDPALNPRFNDIAYFGTFRHLTCEYPAHLHVNLTAAARGSGVGSALVAAFIADVAAAGLPGVHVVTGRAARNVSFYNRLGFIERGSVRAANGSDLVFLARRIDPA
jgi:GNAT superfamily N-acetyltransferase